MNDDDRMWKLKKKKVGRLYRKKLPMPSFLIEYLKLVVMDDLWSQHHRYATAAAWAMRQGQINRLKSAIGQEVERAGLGVNHPQVEEARRAYFVALGFTRTGKTRK